MIMHTHRMLTFRIGTWLIRWHTRIRAIITTVESVVAKTFHMPTTGQSSLELEKATRSPQTLISKLILCHQQWIKTVGEVKTRIRESQTVFE
jgi:hypothetical protein